ncbi:hypothetical protein DPX16_6425 [Anabarilius grahami]|uniref:Uncharacterized protein n=1 Tax=Anabarilius grahami TaxID=495550 RepID=A0A3N0YM14_ANAGA|nr:hypothetical protein DPX16_6425 [Anabarilius grahami]
MRASSSLLLHTGLRFSRNALPPVPQCQVVHHGSGGTSVRRVSALGHLPVKCGLSKSHHGLTGLTHASGDGQVSGLAWLTSICLKLGKRHEVMDGGDSGFSASSQGDGEICKRTGCKVILTTYSNTYGEVVLTLCGMVSYAQKPSAHAIIKPNCGSLHYFPVDE